MNCHWHCKVEVEGKRRRFTKKKWGDCIFCGESGLITYVISCLPLQSWACFLTKGAEVRPCRQKTKAIPVIIDELSLSLQSWGGRETVKIVTKIVLLWVLYHYQVNKLPAVLTLFLPLLNRSSQIISAPQESKSCNRWQTVQNKAQVKGQQWNLYHYQFCWCHLIRALRVENTDSQVIL